MKIPAALVLIATAASGAGAQGPAVSASAVPAFADQVSPSVPDYGLPGSWAAGPFGPGASAAVPAGATPAARRPRVDVFYIHPTTYKSVTRWNQDVSDQIVNAWTDASVIARQASVFNGCCRVFAPRYRQASLLNKDGGRELALRLAYTDVERAFDYYLKHQNHGRPFILAGHSQGGWEIAELLEKRIDGTPLQKKLVAAYIIGIGIAEGDFPRRFKHVAPCETRAQTGCVVQWNSLLPGPGLAVSAKRYEQKFVDAYGDIPGKQTLCVNPLTFDRSMPAAEAMRSLGAVPGDPGDGALRPLVAGKVAAHCERGLLVVEPDPTLELKPLPGGAVMHYHDLGLFYADVRANAVLRSDMWFKR